MINGTVTPLPAFKLRPSGQLWLSDETGDDLSDRPINTGGKARTVAGDFAEELTATLTGGHRLKTDSRCLVCPDIQYNQDTFFETKSVGLTNSAIVYQCRAVKDQHFITEYGKQLYYWFWFHRAEVLKCATVRELRLKLCQTVHAGYVLDFATLHKFLLTQPVKTMNTAYIKTGPNSGARLGYGKYDYGVGWSVRRKDIQALCSHRKSLSLPRKVYGINVVTPNVPLELNMSDWSCLRFIES